MVHHLNSFYRYNSTTIIIDVSTLDAKNLFFRTISSQIRTLRTSTRTLRTLRTSTRTLRTLRTSIRTDKSTRTGARAGGRAWAGARAGGRAGVRVGGELEESWRRVGGELEESWRESEIIFEKANTFKCSAREYSRKRTLLGSLELSDNLIYFW